MLGNPSSFDVAVTTYDMINSVHFGEALKSTIVWRCECVCVAQAGW